MDEEFYSELDLIITKGIKIIATCEIKLTNAPKLSKGNTLAIQTLQSINNFIITPSSDDYPLKENLQVCSIDRFINYYLPILIS